MTTSDPHVHLHVAAPRPAWGRVRWLVAALGVGGAALFVLAFFQQWWSIVLYAPQYPKGLRLYISLKGITGDVHEIDLLNHYIGMAHLEDAAPLERHFAAYGVTAIAVASVGLLLASGRRWNKLVAIPAVAFPLLFLADCMGWLYRFGHHLNPDAPLKIGVFTPQLFGNGKIGQFETYAQPSIGFWVAVVGVACVVAGAIARSLVCTHCAQARCGVTCPRFMVGSGKGE